MFSDQLDAHTVLCPANPPKQSLTTSPPIYLPKEHSRSFYPRDSSCFGRSWSSAQLRGRSRTRTMGFVSLRACCSHCNAIFLPEFSLAGPHHCSVDCKTMDSLSNRHKKKSEPVREEVATRPDTHAETQPPENKDHYEKAVAPFQAPKEKNGLMISRHENVKQSALSKALFADGHCS